MRMTCTYCNARTCIYIIRFTYMYMTYIVHACALYMSTAHRRGAEWHWAGLGDGAVHVDEHPQLL